MGKTYRYRWTAQQRHSRQHRATCQRILHRIDRNQNFNKSLQGGKIRLFGTHPTWLLAETGGIVHKLQNFCGDVAVTESTRNLDNETQSHCSPIDQALIKECLTGDVRAWTTFIRRFGRLIRAVVTKTAQRRGWNITAADCDDITAEVFAQLVYRNAASLRLFAGRSTLTTYLTVIARRVTVRAMLKQSTLPKTLSQSTSFPEQADRTALPQQQIAQQDEIEHYLKQLSTEEQVLLRMHDLEGHSYSEISHATGIPVNSIGPRLSKARKSIRQNDHVTDNDSGMPDESR